MTYLKISKNWTLAIITTVSVVALTYFVFSSIQGTDKNIERSANKTQTAQEGNPTETSTTETETSTSNKTLIAQEEIPTETPLAKTMKPSTNKPSHSKNEKLKNTTNTGKTTSKSSTKKPNTKKERVVSREPKAVDPKKTFTDKEGFVLDNVFYNDVLPSISDSHPYALKEGINFESGYYYSTGKNRCGVRMGISWGDKKYEEYTEVDEQNIIFVEKNEYLTSEGCDFIKGLPPMNGDKIVKAGIHVGGMDIGVGNYQVITGGFVLFWDSLMDFARGRFDQASEKGVSSGTIFKVEKNTVYRFGESIVLKKID